MSNLVFKLMLFTILLNASSGFLLTMYPGAFDAASNNGLDTIPNYTEAFFNNETGIAATVDPSNVIPAGGSIYNRIVDILILGFVKRAVDTVKHYMFGFNEMLATVFRPSLDISFGNYLFGTPGTFNTGLLDIAIGVMYAFGAFTLWTGRSLTGE
jgi:hypothetical protein